MPSEQWPIKTWDKHKRTLFYDHCYGKPFKTNMTTNYFYFFVKKNSAFFGFKLFVQMFKSTWSMNIYDIDKDCKYGEIQ